MGLGLVCAPLTQQRDAVGIRHPDIEKHQIGSVPDITGSGLGCVCGNRDLIAFVLENIADDLSDIGLVVNNQN